MIASWPGECKMIFNRPRHPQSNGKGIFFIYFIESLLLV